MGAAVQVDTATPMLKALAGRIRAVGGGGAFTMRWGAAVRLEAQRRCLSKGGRSFWRDVARSIVVVPVPGGSARVEARHVASAQKQYGGPIRARGRAAGGSDYLTIPIDPMAEGRRARSFALGGVGLFRAPGTNVLGYAERGVFYGLYALVKKTRPQRADPFMPAGSEMLRMGQREALRMLGGR